MASSQRPAEQGARQIVAEERATLPRRFDFAHWGAKWLYLLAFLLDIASFFVLMQHNDPRPLFDTWRDEPWLLWVFSLLGAQIALNGALIWEDAYLHRMNRLFNVAVYYVLGSFWLFVYLLLRVEPADQRPLRQFGNTRGFGLLIALAMLALTVYTLVIGNFAHLLALYQQYPGDLYFAIDAGFNVLFAVPLLLADAKRRGWATIPWLNLALLILLGPFGLAIWLWQREGHKQ